MSDLFISHSSLDSSTASDLTSWLESIGHHSIFLDFDPKLGIPAGVSWEKELYFQLKSCRGFIALISDNWLASSWCFAEFTQARALGKPVFIVKISDCDITKLAQDIQSVDLTRDKDSALMKLKFGLIHAGLDAD